MNRARAPQIKTELAAINTARSGALATSLRFGSVDLRRYQIREDHQAPAISRRFSSGCANFDSITLVKYNYNRSARMFTLELMTKSI